MWGGGPPERGAVCCLVLYFHDNYSQSASYVNMDFALLSTLMLAILSGITRFLISYDIACQWAKFLERRALLYSAFSSFQLSSLSYWRVVVPKFHLAGHGKDCQLNYNINFTKGAARMSGEMIESGWAQSGPIAISTRENGPFARRAILDDHWSVENWRKLRRLRECPAPISTSPYPMLTHHSRNYFSQEPQARPHLEQNTAHYR